MSRSDPTRAYDPREVVHQAVFDLIGEDWSPPSSRTLRDQLADIHKPLGREYLTKAQSFKSSRDVRREPEASRARRPMGGVKPVAGRPLSERVARAAERIVKRMPPAIKAPVARSRFGSGLAEAVGQEKHASRGVSQAKPSRNERVKAARVNCRERPESTPVKRGRGSRKVDFIPWCERKR